MKFWLGVLIFLSPLCQAASFDCSSQKLSATEKTICADEYLSGMDNVLNQQWTAIYEKSLGRGLLKAQQLDWLKQRASCGTDVNCIKEKYQERVAWFSEYEPFAPLNKYFRAERIDPPLAEGLVSEGGYQLRDNHWLIKPVISAYELRQLSGDKFEEVISYKIVGHAIANDNLFLYITVDKNGGDEPALFEVNDAGQSRIITRFANKYTLYADPEGQNEPGRVHFYMHAYKEPDLKVSMEIGDAGALVDTLEYTPVPVSLLPYEDEGWQGFCAGRLCRSYSQSPSKKWRITSPYLQSTDENDGVYLFEGDRPDTGINVFNQKANERVDPDFGFSRNFVWGEGNSFFFDNEGGVACVWRTDIDAKKTERIIPVESVRYPYFLKFRGREMVAAIDTDNIGGIGGVYIATPR